ncbi:hypothetical protein N7461_007023 [Penicillium sp. DV-2018c]|nr:hypothetical protein N7461_007023 [Penicillium sp. DV-2018c]
MSVRKAHNSGRNHLRNVVDYYQQIGQEKAQSVIDSITSSYAAEGQQVPNMMAPGAFPPPPFPGFPGRPGMPPPPFGIPPPGAPGAPAMIPPPGVHGGLPFPPPSPTPPEHHQQAASPAPELASRRKYAPRPATRWFPELPDAGAWRTWLPACAWSASDGYAPCAPCAWWSVADSGGSAGLGGVSSSPWWAF